MKEELLQILTEAVPGVDFEAETALVDDEILVRDAIRENIDWKSLDCELVGDCENGRQAVEFEIGRASCRERV